MKILIVSDSHRRDKNLWEVIKKVKPIDMLIHLGDAEGSEYAIQMKAECPVHIVAGNNDFFTELDKEEEFMIGKYRVLITHGHYYYVNFGTSAIKEEALARNIDIVMYGHTHKPLLEMDDQLIVLNPGSISYPRQEGRKPSYMIMDLDKHGDAHFTINYL